MITSEQQILDLVLVGDEPLPPVPSAGAIDALTEFQAHLLRTTGLRPLSAGERAPLVATTRAYEPETDRLYISFLQREPASARTVRQGARDARVLIGAGRLLAQALVQAVIQDQARRRDPQSRALLLSCAQSLLTTEQREQSARTAARAEQRALNARTAATLADLRAREQLAQVFASLQQGQQVNWDALVQAGRTLDRLLAADGPPPR